jgi:hypothetical protein
MNKEEAYIYIYIYIYINKTTRTTILIGFGDSSAKDSKVDGVGIQWCVVGLELK